jgi:phospholipid transport system substrate-binding protein
MSNYGRLGGRAGAALAVALSLAAGAGWAAPKQTATEAIKAGNDKLRELLGQKTTDQASIDKVNAQTAKELRGLFDIGFLAQRSLVDHWEKITPKQRTDLSTTLQEVIEKNYLSQLRGNLDYKIDYLSEEPAGADVLVKTFVRAQKNGRPTKISIDYRLRPEGDQWRVYDVITEEVSILQNYRTQFNRIIAKDGVDGLLTRMRSRLEKGEKVEPASK